MCTEISRVIVRLVKDILDRCVGQETKSDCFYNRQKYRNQYEIERTTVLVKSIVSNTETN
jgi:hypothetical protein